MQHGIVLEMSKRHSLSGNRISGNHTSMIPLAYDVAVVLLKHEQTEKLSPGIITTSVANLGGMRRIKIMRERANILLRVRDNGALQEVRVFGEKNVLEELVCIFCEKEKIKFVSAFK